MLEVRLLGKFEVLRDGDPILIASRPAQSLLAYLILNTGTVYRREKLAGLLWPDSDEVRARNNLRQTLWRLRKAVGEDYFLTDKVSVGFNPSADFKLDAAVLQDEVTQTVPVETLMRVVSLYEDSLLPGFYDEWVVLEQERLQAVFEDRMQLLLDRLIEEARWREAREWSEWWIARGQVPEPAYRALMMAQAGLGDLASVASVFQRCVQALDEEVGVEPSRATRDLFQRLTSGEALPGAEMDGAQPRPMVNLPLQSTPFVGREDEVSQLATLLADPSIKLVTILGPGGIGKTRLAIQAAEAQRDTFVDGVYFVSLAALDNPVLIASQIADALNFSFHVRDQGERWEYDSQSEQLLAYLRGKQLLLVLDNTEHLLISALPPLEEWKKGVEELVADVVRVAPDVKILTTSRERLNLKGETLLALGGLDFPKGLPSEEKGDVAAYSALQLFAKSARRVQPTFELRPENVDDVIKICRLVDGMPLGIELAAAWVELLSPAEISAEIQNSLDFLATDLRDIPDRQRSLRSVFESTWNRLTTDEQDVFGKLSVFRGGFTRDGAHHVTGASLQMLLALMHKSLIWPDFRGRYQSHELLRQFGAERLGRHPSEEATAKDRHCGYYATFLREKEPHLIGRDQGKALDEIETELDNVRTAWDWAVAQGKLEELDRTMDGLCAFFRIRGRLDEGFETFNPAAHALGWEGFKTPEELPDRVTRFNQITEWLDAASVSSENVDEQQRIMGKVLARYGRFYCEAPGRAEGACQVRQDSLKILSRSGEPLEMAYVLRYLAHARQMPWEAQELYQKALLIFEEFNDERGMAETLYRLGMVATQLGHYPEAEQLYQDSLSISQKTDRREIIMDCLAELGYVQWVFGNYQAAEGRCLESLSISTEIGYFSQIASAYRYLARIAVGRGDYGAAKGHLGDSLAIYEETGLRGMRAKALGELAHVGAIEGDLETAKQVAQESLLICEELEHRGGLIEPLTVLGQVGLGLGDLQEAEVYFQNALKTAMEVWAPSLALHTLVGMANLLAVTGEKERTFDLAQFILHHAASWQWSKDSVAPLVAELEPGLSSERVAAARAWAKGNTLEGVIEELLIGSPVMPIR